MRTFTGKTYDYRNADWEAVRCKFTELYHTNKIESSNPQVLLDKLIEVLRQTEEQSFQLKAKRYSNKNQWDSKKIQKLAHKKRSLFVQFKRNNSNDTQIEYKRAIKRLKKR